MIQVSFRDVAESASATLATVSMEVLPRNSEYVRIDGQNYVVTSAVYGLTDLLRGDGTYAHSETIVWVAKR